MKKLKLMTIIGTRPEIIRLSECIKLNDTLFEHILTHTGQNYDYELNEVFFEDFALRKPDYFLNCAGANLGETIGNVISKSYALLSEVMPDAVLILGDTNSCLCAISAKRLKIPIFHMEAGNRCFDPNVPEEINRKIIDHTSDINLCYTEHARRNLMAEGLHPQYVFVTGSPMLEVLTKNKAAIDNSDILDKQGLNKDGYIVLSAHREENVDNEANFNSLMSAVNAVAENYKLPIIFSTHPRSKKRIEERGFVFNALVKSIPPLGFFDYIKLQQNAYCVLSDSGTLSEEAAMLNFPAVLIRTSTERPEAVDAGAIVLGGITENTILPGIELMKSVRVAENVVETPIAAKILVADYRRENVSRTVSRVIRGYAGTCK